MLRFLFVFLFLTCPLSAIAAPTLFADGLEHNFGSILQGQTVQDTFRFQNSGDDILEILSVRTSCGCTAALLSARRLAPGEVGELSIKFDSQGFRGNVHKTIEITTNDPNQPRVVFSLKGTVELEIFASPERVNWGTVEKRDTLKSQIILYNHSKDVVAIGPLKIVGKGIVAEPSESSIAAGGSITIDISAEFSQKTPRISGYVIIPTDFSLVPQIRVPVSARMSRK